ncbi:MAG: VWA domain-containing protein [Planctomycetota bacterium]|nr:VWA domain-containing protein [Planctomycetota bacterium]
MLTPGAALIAASLGVPLLVALYVLKLRRRPVRVSTALFWPRATSDVEANVPWRTPRFTWLFVLHLLIVLLLCAALGRPALTGGGRPPDELILVLSRSATMDTRDADGTPPSSRLREAIRRADDLLDEASRSGRGVRATLISFAADARIEAGPTDDLGLVRDTLERMEIADQPANLTSAMRVLGGLLASDQEDTRTRRVVLLGDGVWDAAEADAPATIEYMRVGPPQGTPVDNAGLAALATRRDDADPTKVRVFVRVVNAGAAPRATTLTLALNGTVLERRAVTVPARSAPKSGAAPTTPAATPAAGDPPNDGTLNLTLVAVAPGGGVLTVSLPDEDALACDNLAGATLLPPKRPTLLLVGPNPTLDATPDAETRARTEASELLADVLRQVPSAGLTRTTIARWEQDGRPRADVIVFDSVTPTRVPDAPTLSLGAGLPAAPLSLAPAGSLVKQRVVSWDRKHPALRDLALDALLADTTRQLPALNADSPSAADLIIGDHGTLLREATIAGRSHLVTPFALADSNWALQVSFPLFVVQAIEYLSRAEQTAAGLKFVTTQPVELEATAPSVRLEGPRQVEAPATRDGGVSRATLGVLSRAGVYIARGASVPAIVSNVTDDTVSRAATRDHISIGGRTLASGVGETGPREIWSWLLVLAFALLAVEWLVFARSSRPDAQNRV